MSTKNFNSIIESLKQDLGDSLLSSDVWIKGTGQSIATHNGGNAKAAALFDQLNMSIVKALETAKFPEINHYFVFPVEDEKLIGVMSLDKYLCGFLVDSTKVRLGLLLNVALENALDEFNNL